MSPTAQRLPWGFGRVSSGVGLGVIIYEVISRRQRDSELAVVKGLVGHFYDWQ